jgi:hypothetical protein
MMRPATTEQPNPTARPTALSCCLSPGGGLSFGSRNDCESYHNASTPTTNQAREECTASASPSGNAC